MTGLDLPAEPDPADIPGLKRLLIATLVAACLAGIILVVAVLPAEYGIDPTGIGDATGLLALGEDPEPKPVTPDIIESTPLYRFNGSWVESTALLGEYDGTLAVGETETVVVDVTRLNVTRLTAVLSWTDDAVASQQTDPDTFRLDITAPTAEERTWLGRNEGAAGTLDAPYVVAATPGPISVTASDEADARTQITTWHPEIEGSWGRWTLNITLTEAGGYLAAPDEGNTWSLRIFTTAADLVMGQPEATGIREDRIDLQIPSLANIEYKVYASEGASFTYAWKSPVPVNYDFHGARDSGLEESHESANAASRSDDFLVPFNGKHGWFWQNDSPQSITITLTLRGQYSLLA